MQEKKILGLCCTNGRFSYLQRLLTCFLHQNYENKMLLIYNNADIPIDMEPIKNVILVNNCIDLVTNDVYKDVGSIHRDALSFCPDNIDYISIMDDDDIFLPHHYSTANKYFYENSKTKVWQPSHYFYKYSKFNVELRTVDNNLEGSCVIEFDYLKKIGFGVGNSLEYNLSWFLEAGRTNVLSNENSSPTFCCEYGQQDVIHTSIFSDDNPQLNRVDLNERLKQRGDFGQGQVLQQWSKSDFELFTQLYFDINNYD